MGEQLYPPRNNPNAITYGTSSRVGNNVIKVIYGSELSFQKRQKSLSLRIIAREYLKVGVLLRYKHRSSSAIHSKAVNYPGR